MDRPRTPEAWDAELKKIEAGLPQIVARKPNATIGVAVDDDLKRDYFVPRLQEMLDRNPYLSRATISVIPMTGTHIDLRARNG